MKIINNNEANIKKIKNDNKTWRMVKDLIKTLKKGDELGFVIKKSHYIIRKGDFSKF